LPNEATNGLQVARGARNRDAMYGPIHVALRRRTILESFDRVALVLDDFEEQREAEQVKHIEDFRLQGRDLDVAAELSHLFDVSHENAKPGAGDILKLVTVDDDLDELVVFTLLDGRFQLGSRVGIQFSVEVQNRYRPGGPEGD